MVRLLVKASHARPSSQPATGTQSHIQISAIPLSAQGLAVVATDVGGLSELVDNGVNGVLIPRGDVGALSAALARLISDAPRRLQLGTAARLTYEARFRLEYMIEKTAAIYEMALTHDAAQ